MVREEKSNATCEKYIRDVRGFRVFAGNNQVAKELVVAWKKKLIEQGYAVRSINSMLASVNSFLGFLGWHDCKVKNIRLQRQTYCAEEKELTKAEYLRLLEASRKNEQLNLVLQTICGTGIRVSELRYFTVEAVRNGEITVNCKSKTRTILVPGKLRKLLLSFAKQRHITAGAIFIGKSGKPIDRSNIWRQMKQLCKAAGVKESKVFPHNLRKLFARTFYQLCRRVRHKPEQHDKDENRSDNPYAEINPIQMHDIQGQNTDPVADLTAQVGGQYGQHGKDRLVVIEQHEKQHQRDVDDQRIDLLGHLCPEQSEGRCGYHAHSREEGKQNQNISAIHPDAQKGGRNIDAKQERERVVQEAQYSINHM